MDYDSIHICLGTSFSQCFEIPFSTLSEPHSVLGVNGSVVAVVSVGAGAVLILNTCHTLRWPRLALASPHTPDIDGQGHCTGTLCQHLQQQQQQQKMLTLALLPIFLLPLYNKYNITHQIFKYNQLTLRG